MREITWYQWVAILALVVLVVGRFFNRRKNDDRMVIPKLKPRTANADGMSRLVSGCFGDRDKAIRLIQFEKTKASGINHAEAVKRALERLYRDRRA